MLSTAFHIRILPRPADADGPRPMFARTFEQVAQSLADLPRMFVEPDGSFVWVAAAGPAWQIDGVLYDGAERLWYMELQGRCPPHEFDRLLLALGWPETPVRVQLVREGELMEEQEFRRSVGWAAG
ncbi:MAG TPA: hypothetical protein VNH11_13420 [Pirellulales bacterium]|nr:hypothetical protein [Pirellulales bacterium]